jgi:hypothetical protein
MCSTTNSTLHSILFYRVQSAFRCRAHCDFYLVHIARPCETTLSTTLYSPLYKTHYVEFFSAFETVFFLLITRTCSTQFSHAAARRMCCIRSKTLLYKNDVRIKTMSVKGGVKKKPLSPSTKNIYLFCYDMCLRVCKMSNTLACPHPLLGAPRCQFSLGGLDPGEGLTA